MNFGTGSKLLYHLGFVMIEPWRHVDRRPALCRSAPRGDVVSAPRKPTCRIVRPADAYGGRQGELFAGIAAETVGSTGLCMHVVTIPPGARAKAHLRSA
jgi:hypothetical protein